MNKDISRFIPKRLRPIVARIIDTLGDTVDLLLGRRDALTPPRGLRRMVIGVDDVRLYRALGELYLLCFKALCALKPNEDVLDVGCGCGKQAAPLVKYLGKSSTYEGFDIVGSMIEWCRKNISSKYPNFHFQLADVFNKQYNPRGKYEASKYKFPYSNESFDFAYALSVFTHMLPEDMEHYLSEIARVLKSGGRCLITYFLLNEESLELINAGTTAWDFKYDFGKYRATDYDTPEAAICYDEAFVLGLYEQYGLRIKRPIRYGSWSWRDGSLDFEPSQDTIVAWKE